jgi:hypothetical protein
MSSLGRHFVPLSRPSIQRRLQRSHYTPPFSRLMPVPRRFFFYFSEHKKEILFRMMNYFLISLSQIFFFGFQFERPSLSRGTFGPVSTRQQVLDNLIAPSPCSFEYLARNDRGEMLMTGLASRNDWVQSSLNILVLITKHFAVP